MNNNYTPKGLNQSELVQKVVLKCNQEYNGYEIVGGNYIQLMQLDFANVSLYYNTRNNREGAMQLNNQNRGMKWNSRDPNTGESRLFPKFYIWTEGISTIDLIIEVSSNGDILTPLLGNSAVVESFISGLSPATQINLNNAINNTYSNINPIQFVDSGYWEKEFNTAIKKTYPFYYSPFFENIQSLNLKNDSFYKVHIFGHADIVPSNKYEYEYYVMLTLHLALFNNDNSVTFTQEPTSAGLANALYSLSGNPYNANGYFDIFGMLNKEISDSTYSVAYQTSPGAIEKNFIVKGDFLNKYTYFGLLFNVNMLWGNGGNINVGTHHSFILTISEAFTNEQPATNTRPTTPTNEKVENLKAGIIKAAREFKEAEKEESRLNQNSQKFIENPEYAAYIENPATMPESVKKEYEAIIQGLEETARKKQALKITISTFLHEILKQYNGNLIIDQLEPEVKEIVNKVK